MPDTEFYDMIEDDKGYIWLAADRGLFRYDGNAYIKVEHPNKIGLSVFNLKKDSRGRIWCRNRYGQFFYTEGDELKLFIDLKDNFGISTQFIDYNVSATSLNVSNVKHTYFIDLKTKTTIYEKDTPHQGRRNTDIIHFKNHNYILLDSILKINYLGEKIASFPIDHQEDNYNSFFSFKRNLYLYRSRNKIPVAEEGLQEKLFRVDPEKGLSNKNLLPKRLQNKFINSIKEINNQLWFVTNEGVFLYDFVDNNLVFKIVLFQGEYITQVVQDFKGKIWVTTLKNGIFLIPNYDIQIQNLAESGEVVSFLFHNNTMICGKKKGKLVVQNLAETNDKKEFDVFNLVGEIIWLKKASPNLIFFFGSRGSLLWNIELNTLHEVENGSYLRDINYREEDNLFFVSDPSDCYYFENNLKFKNQQRNKEPVVAESIFFQRNNVLLNGNSWKNFTTSKAIVYVSGSYKLYRFSKGFKQEEISFHGKDILANSFTETNDGVVWIASPNLGLLKVDENQKITNFELHQNTQDNKILHVLADGNNLWVLGETHLSFYNRKENSVIKFDLINELRGNKIKEIRLHQNKLYVLGRKAIVTIDKKVLNEKIYPERIIFKDILFGNEKFKVESKYSLPHDKNEMELYFDVLGSEIGSKTFKYRLLGLSEKWSVTNETQVRYPYIPYGQYVFQIKALNRKNNKYNKHKEIIITIASPFWMQWWFISGVILLIILVLFLFVKRVRRNQRNLFEKERLSKELIFSRLENLRSQMNPHFIFNTLNSIQGYIITNKKEEASIYLAEFSQLIRMYLDFSRKQFTKLPEEIKALETYLKLEQLRIGESFQYTINTSNVGKGKLMNIPSLFIQPYIENAIKHGLFPKEGIKKLDITFSYLSDEEALICVIDDNGVGRERAKELKRIKSQYHSSYAIEANEDRTNLLNKNRKEKVTITIQDKFSSDSISEGTKVIIKIPQEDESYSN
ncbi:histidine kinase [uncultured Tenacibaculum sp.]|uniref:sensor histidine kinase n=1 Tax=uncultured Tenacibaculum sp. TaxID=174713 RepID=UPI002607B135|nr:histidine kinase [uncultured Tenacibaculum sp.]